MLPYYHLDLILLGPIPIHVWGLLVSLGILAGLLVALKYAKKYFLSAEVVLDAAIWMLIGAFIMSRFVHVVFYDPAYYVSNPADIIKFWQGGASSLGGFIGAFLSLYLFAKYRRFKLKEFLPYLDVMALGLWLGWGIGRIGCFLTNQHPGKLTDFFLSVKYPEGTRFELGLFESMVGFLIFFVTLAMFKRFVKKRWGLAAALSFGAYALIRFFLDFLRATPLEIAGGDARYLALTPAQWGMMAVILGLTATAIYAKIMRTRHGGFA